MSFIFQPTLQHIATAKIAIAICSRDDITPTLIHDIEWGLYLPKEHKKLPENIIQLIDNLPLPKPLKNAVSSYIKPIGHQMFRWFQRLDNVFRVPLQHGRKWLRWTSAGTVDEKKSVGLLVKDQTLGAETRYKLACNFCLVDDIRALMRPGRAMDLLLGRPHDIVDFWTVHLKGKEEDLRRMMTMRLCTVDTPYSYAFSRAWEGGNLAAIEYFYGKLSRAEKDKAFFQVQRMLEEEDDVVLHAAVSPHMDRKGYNVDILLLLLASRSEKQKKKQLNRFYLHIIPRLLKWPYHSLFLPLVNRMWGVISPEDFINLLGFNFNRITRFNHENCLFRDIFKDFWFISPREYKKYVLNDEAIWRMLCHFLEHEEKDICRMMLNDASAEEKENLLFDSRGRCEYMELVRKKKWDSFEFFIEECSSSEEMADKFRKIIGSVENYCD